MCSALLLHLQHDVDTKLLCRTLIKQHGTLLGLEQKRVPANAASTQFAEALAQAWAEFNIDRFGMLCLKIYVSYALHCYLMNINCYLFHYFLSAVIMMIVQPEERNMYDQYWLSKHLQDSYPSMFCFHVSRRDQIYNFFCCLHA
jgi:glutathione synthase